MSLPLEQSVDGDVVVRHRLAYPAFPAEVARASREARQAMRWPMVITAGLVLLALTATLAILMLVRPGAAAMALGLSGLLLLYRALRPGRSYDASTGWVYRSSILGGAAGELISQLTLASGTGSLPSWTWLATDALGIGGAIGLAIGVVSATAAFVIVFLSSVRSVGKA